MTAIGVCPNKDFLARRRRSGYVYIAVLFTSLIVAASVAASLSLSTSSMRADIDRINRKSALRLAETELHRVAAYMNGSANWRTAKTSGVFSGWIVLSDDGVQSSDTAQVRHRLTDGDGDLSDDPTDSVDLVAHAVVGNSAAAVTVKIEPRFVAESILDYGITAYDDIQIEGGGTLTSERDIQVGDDCKTNTSGLLTTSVLECNGRVEMLFRGQFQNSATVNMPTHDVVDKYVQAGTQIAITSLPTQDGRRIIQDVVVSAAENPYGTADAGGIYWIDAGNQTIRISNCRIAATLAIRNANLIEVEGGVVWTYAAGPEAILVSDSAIKFDEIETTLDESLRSTNFNPSSTPYRETLFNSTATDIFPTEIRGVIFTTEDIQFDPTVGDLPITIVGSVICRDLWVYGFVNVRQLGEVIQTPPLGLTNVVPMQFVRGSFRRIPTP